MSKHSQLGAMQRFDLQPYGMLGCYRTNLGDDKLLAL